MQSGSPSHPRPLTRHHYRSICWSIRIHLYPHWNIKVEYMW
jgi:hypothetical protein